MFNDDLSAEDMILIRRALEAYHVYLMALNSSSVEKSKNAELKRVEELFHKIGELKAP